jgi:predicted 3-demethylubiquinone-9 3-methyltransferase (glyoxalase superfamily)
MQTITPFLWFADLAEDAMNFYVSIFPNSKVNMVTRYGDAGPGPKGSVMTASFELNGQPFTALNGGPRFSFNSAVSFVVPCDSQAEIDHYWEKLGAGGDPSAQQCGWLRDKYGLSWQIVPSVLSELVKGDPARSNRVMEALLPMKKLDIAALERAAGQA